MDFTLTADQLFIRTTLRKLIQRECPREKAHALDELGTFPAELLTKIAEIGFCGLNTPETFGGGGQDLLGTVRQPVRRPRNFAIWEQNPAAGISAAN
jgi:alkylation response protein AidB-like acyl-CoA dehydrogenase